MRKNNKINTKTNKQIEGEKEEQIVKADADTEADSDAEQRHKRC